MRSLGKVLERYSGIGPGFDLLRLVLSISIRAFHSIGVSYGDDRWIWFKPVSAPASALLPMFFALSGFLVIGSALRTGKLMNFIVLRVLRIVPALATEISLSAIVFGALMTTLPLSAYFTNHEFFEYFGSLIGRVRVTLPGVFVSNPLPFVVNVSLWTITPELLCYVYISLLIVTGIYRHKLALTALVAALAIYFIGNDLIFGVKLYGVRPQPHFLVISFAFGNLIYLWKDKIPYSWIGLAIGVVVGLVFVRTPGLCYLSFFAWAYIIVFLGLTPMPKVPVLSKGDYSYGIYLYAFPVQQVIANTFPHMRTWYWNMAFSLPIVIGIAMLSWTFVEKPTLALRKTLVPKSAPGATAEPNLLTSWAVLSGLFAYGFYLCIEAGMFNLAGTTLTAAAVVITGLSGVAAAIIFGKAALARRAGPAIIQAQPGE